ncbi:MAG: Phosphoribosylformylglycinamidine synthase, purS [Synergistales bacterium 53_16]|nr:MAG: Phosphoribosylformylglycinamidine synthase, purS [Synergistales bacterium 53_16]MDN5336580.1 phosphoribosylformylglycinamidine synthase subunit PurS [Synergistales bacterium]
MRRGEKVMSYTVEVLVYLKNGVLDTQGKAVKQSLRRLGFEDLEDVRVGKYIQLRINAENKEVARARTKEMCVELLVNELIEEFDIKVVD